MYFLIHILFPELITELGLNLRNVQARIDQVITLHFPVIPETSSKLIFL